jgi:hypothetical protein
MGLTKKEASALGRKGGKARAERLTSKQRVAIARKGHAAMIVEMMRKAASK